jgi:hypothetical protein
MATRVTYKVPVNPETGLPIKDIPMWESPESVKEYVKTTYIDTGLMIEVQAEDNDPAKQKSKTWTFATPLVEARFKTDPILVENANNIKAHNLKYGIITVIEEV